MYNKAITEDYILENVFQGPLQCRWDGIDDDDAKMMGMITACAVSLS